MVSSLRRGAIAALLVVTVGYPAAAAAAPLPADSSALQFFGFRAGARLDDLARLLRRHDGAELRCDRARLDRRVTECRAVLDDPALGGPVELWVSAMDSAAGVITLSGDVDGDRLDRWREAIEARYGRVGARVQGSQWMMQWVRRGRMLRLTWRTEGGGKVASVSLIDGRVLDGWARGRGGRRSVAPAPVSSALPAHPSSRTR